mgnify:CR=1
MKYLVINTTNFTVQTDVVNDEEGTFKSTKSYDCQTSAKLGARENGDVVVVSLSDHLESKENQAQRIQDQQREIESLQGQLNAAKAYLKSDINGDN